MNFLDERNNSSNKLYVEEMKEKSKRGLIVGSIVVTGVFYFLEKYFL